MANWWDLIWSGPQVDTQLRDLMIKEAEEARKREEARAAAITTGKNAINTQFAGFGDNFYNERRNAVMDYYQPQLDEKMDNARKALTYAFARAGTLNSSMAGQRSADLTKNYDLQKGQLVSSAEGDVQSLKNAVANQKNSLLSQLNATGDANQASDAALAATQQIYASRPQYSPLGDIFAGVTQGIGNTFNSLDNIAFNRAYYGGSGGGGTTRTVRT